MGILVFLLCLAASTIGGVCGIGGGVIMKPVLDAMGIMSVSSISFLSGLTVMSMAVISVFQQRKEKLVEFRIGSLLALGAVAGGILGNMLFQIAKAAAGNDRFVGMMQAIVLAVITFITLIYSTVLRARIRSYRVQNAVACVLIGGGMGVLSSFLGIGGGPINLAVLYFAFSMGTKKAVAHSLYIILFSQLSGFVTACVRGGVPEFPWKYLLLMISAGVFGGIIGSHAANKISEKTADKLFAALLWAIILICIYNAIRFVGKTNGIHL